MPAMLEDSNPADRLADGSLPATPAAVIAALAALGIVQTTRSHAPVFTVEQARAERAAAAENEEVAHIKNLFLRNKKGRMWLVTCLEARQIDLKALGRVVGAGRLSFASHERLRRHLGVLPGAVTPLAVINDRTDEVSVVLDLGLRRKRYVNVHPLVNSMTTTVATEALARILVAWAHPPQWVDLDDPALGRAPV